MNLRSQKTRAIGLSALLLFLPATNAQEVPDASELREKTTKLIDWPESKESQVVMAMSILESYALDARNCEIALKIYGVDRLSKEQKNACVKSVEMTIKGSRYMQAGDKLTQIANAGGPIDKQQMISVTESIREGLKSLAFIKERLFRR